MQTIALAPVALPIFTERDVYANSEKDDVPLEIHVPPLFARATNGCVESKAAPVLFTHIGLIKFPVVGSAAKTGLICPSGSTDCNGKLKVHLCC